MRREGPSRELSTAVTVEGKQGSAAVTHRSGQWDANEGEQDARRGGAFIVALRAKRAYAG
jgi:hypothetical protein